MGTYTTTDYANEVFNYGGIPTKRIDIIRHLESIGGTQRQIDLYLMGLDRMKERNSEREKQ